MSQGSSGVESRLEGRSPDRTRSADFVGRRRASARTTQYAALYARACSRIPRRSGRARRPTSSFARRSRSSRSGRTLRRRARAKFFLGATLNLTESCPDRHLATATRTRAALVWEGEPGDVRTAYVLRSVPRGRAALRALADLGVKPGDRVAIYMGMVPEAVVAMLGARASVHSTPSCSVAGSGGAPRRINDLGAGSCSSRRTARGAAATSSRSRRWPTPRS